MVSLLFRLHKCAFVLHKSMMSFFANLTVQVAGTNADFVIKSQQELVHKFSLVGQ